MLKRKYLFLSVAVAIAGAVIVYYLSSDGKSGGLVYKEGEKYTYRYSLNVTETAVATGSNRLKLAGIEKLETESDLEAELTVRCYRASEDGYLVGYEFDNFSRESMIVNGKDSEKISESAVEIFARLGRDGHMEALFFRDDAPARIKNVLKSMASETQVVIPGGKKKWRETETTARGYAVQNYQMVSSGPFSKEKEIEKNLEGYRLLTVLPSDDMTVESSGSGKVVLEEGTVRSFNYSEKVEGSENTRKVYSYSGKVDMELLSKGTLDRELPRKKAEKKKKKEYTPAEQVSDEFLHRNNMRQAAAGMDEKELKELFDTFRKGEMSEEEARAYMWRIHGYLALHPDRVTTVQSLLTQADVPSGVRKMFFPVLCANSSPEVQKSLREMLDHRNIKNDPFYVSYIQNLGFLEKPERATGTAVRNIMMNSDGKRLHAAAGTLGSISAAMRKNGNSSRADELNSVIVEKLNRAETEGDRSELLLALSNAENIDNVEVIEEYSRDESPVVRNSSALALRNIQTPESELLLDRLTGDRNTNVQNSALLSLSKYRNSGEQFKRLERKISSGTIKEQSYQMVMTVLRKNINTNPRHVNKLCDTMMSSDNISPRMKKQLRHMQKMTGYSD